ncbi:MAG: flagellar basal-body rod protein FlgF [Devosia sp.]|uniref:flagellar basal-body rod protein FlgF n=1 Tax=Devosia sp. 66-22 TaxID=1895753 RepID=UPI00092A1B6A|nr:flagellar basal-body rod protein FlgF [Devosia sp. 66-22]MBN9348450.1 flagellar basal-body rod protein FlgF [Devosia sp.]OJX54735.1 MAG: flagellar basal-body rod protein FlgF [Devosia sp. 66-22]
MENAQLVTLSRQIALQHQMDVVANNMANINTTGFKASDLMFEDYLMPVARDNDFAGMDRRVHFTQDWTTMHDMSAGSVEQTGDPLDVALMGDGFLTVDTPAGERYTRAGALTIDANGTLVDLNGNPVLGTSGAIKFDDSDIDITIGSDGTVATNNGAKGKLAIAQFIDPQILVREGDNYFSGPAGNAPVTTRVMQGAIERSNVSGVTELTTMIRVQRAYQSLASLMQKQDELRGTAIQRLGEVRA